jgi:threonine/homoserine/homoserine lactone efflux protein
MVLTLLIGFAFGYFGSMPVAGPIAVLVLRLGLDHHPRQAMAIAAGGAVAESGYALLAFWGLATALDRYPMLLPASRAVGAVILLGLGLALLLRQPRDPAAAPAAQGRIKRSIFFGFLITALNPTLIITWTAAVTALHGTGLLRLSQGQAVPFALAVSLGIVAWFATLLALVARFHDLWTPAGLNRFMRAMGGLLLAIGAWMATRALANLFR